MWKSSQVERKIRWGFDINKSKDGYHYECFKTQLFWKIKAFLNIKKKGVVIQETCLSFEKNIGFFKNDLCISDPFMVYDQRNYLSCEKYIGFFTNDLYSGDLFVLCDQVTCP